MAEILISDSLMRESVLPIFIHFKCWFAV